MSLPDLASQELAALQHADRLECATAPSVFVARHVQIEEPNGRVIPFRLWRFQQQTLEALHEHPTVVVLKARRLGLSWVALAYALWLAIFQQGIRILILCKTEGDASELLDRVRRMRDRLALDPASHHLLATLPRPAKVRDAVTTLDVGASTIRALVGTPAAARSETAGFVLADEFAFQRKASGIWRALLPTIEGGGRLAVVSTGDGDVGDGAEFAQQWHRAVSGESGFHHLFWPWDVRPDRDEDWKQRTLAAIGDPDRFATEYPETPDDAFRRPDVTLVYNQAGVDAAQELGRALDEDSDLVPPVDDELHLGIDWGEQTHALIGHPLEGGGVYIRSELPLSGVEAGEASEDMLDRLLVFLLKTADAQPGTAYYDAAGRGSMRTFKKRRNSRPPPLGLDAQERPGLKIYRVAFGEYKTETVDYLRRLFNRTAQGLPTGVIAISPQCSVLLRQLRNLQTDPDTGKVAKVDDHGPDALVALTAIPARRHRKLEDQIAHTG